MQKFICFIIICLSMSDKREGANDDVVVVLHREKERAVCVGRTFRDGAQPKEVLQMALAALLPYSTSTGFVSTSS